MYLILVVLLLPLHLCRWGMQFCLLLTRSRTAISFPLRLTRQRLAQLARHWTPHLALPTRAPAPRRFPVYLASFSPSLPALPDAGEKPELRFCRERRRECWWGARSKWSEGATLNWFTRMMNGDADAGSQAFKAALRAGRRSNALLLLWHMEDLLTEDKLLSSLQFSFPIKTVL